MKKLSIYIDEALRLGKGKRYRYTVKNKPELQRLVDKLYNKDTHSCDLSMIDTSQLTEATYIFYNHKDTIKEIDVTGWDVSNFRHFYKIFEGCSSLERIIGLDTWNVDASKLDWANLGFEHMFRFCSSLKTIDLSTWKMIGKNIDMKGMFDSCFVLETVKGIDDWQISISRGNTEKLKNLFNNCSNLRCDISKWPNIPISARNLTKIKK